MIINREVRDMLYEMAETNTPISLRSLINTLKTEARDGKMKIYINEDVLYADNDDDFDLTNCFYWLRSSDINVYNVATMSGVYDDGIRFYIAFSSVEYLEYDVSKYRSDKYYPIDYNDIVLIVHFDSIEDEPHMDKDKFVKDKKAGRLCK